MQKNLLGGLLALLGWVSAGIGTGGTQLFPEFLSNCGYSERDFTQLVRALSKELNFFNENLDKIVSDAGLGTRILERNFHLVVLTYLMNLMNLDFKYQVNLELF